MSVTRANANDEGRFPSRLRKGFTRMDSVKFKTIEIFEVPKWVRRLSECKGLVLFLAWLGYAAYVSVIDHLGWPASHEQWDIALVAILAFAAGWACVRIGFCLISRAQTELHRAGRDVP